MQSQHISYCVHRPDVLDTGSPPGSCGHPYLLQENHPSMRSRSVMGKGKLCHCTVPCLVITTCILEQARERPITERNVHVNMVTVVEPRESAQHCGQHSFVPGLLRLYICILFCSKFFDSPVAACKNTVQGLSSQQIIHSIIWTISPPSAFVIMGIHICN